MVGQIGTLIVINLVFGFGFNSAGGNIDNAAHIGGLLAGLWLGFVLVPGNVRTVRDLWQTRELSPGEARRQRRSPAARPGPPAGDRRLARARSSIGLAIGTDLSALAQVVGGGVDRQDDAEAGAVGRDVLGDRLAAVGPGELADDRQAETGARPGPAGIAAVEALERPLDVARREARAVVGDAQRDGRPPVGAGRCRPRGPRARRARPAWTAASALATRLPRIRSTASRSAAKARSAVAVRAGRRPARRAR